MKSFVTFLADLFWIAGAVAFAFYFLKTFLAIELIAGGTTYLLWRVERSWQ